MNMNILIVIDNETLFYTGLAKNLNSKIIKMFFTYFFISCLAQTGWGYS